MHSGRKAQTDEKADKQLKKAIELLEKIKNRKKLLVKYVEID